MFVLCGVDQGSGLVEPGGESKEAYPRGGKPNVCKI